MKYPQTYLNHLLKGDKGQSFVFSRRNKNKIVITDNVGNGYVWSIKTKLWEPKTKRDIENSIPACLEPVILYFLEDETLDKDTIKALEGVLRKVYSTKGCKSIYCMVIYRLEDFEFESKLNNKHPSLFPIRNGEVVELDTGKTRPRQKEDMFSFETTVSISTNEEKMKELIAFLKTVFQDNVLSYQCLQVLCGYCLTAEMDDQELYIWWGNASNGKSTIIRLLSLVMGEFFTYVRSEFLSDHYHFINTAHASNFRNLIGRRCVTCQDAGEIKESVNKSMLKYISKGDSFKYHKAYSAKYESIKPKCKCIIQTNHKPQLKDRSGVLPFPVRFVNNPNIEEGEHKSDWMLVKKMETEYLDEFFTWCVTGAQKYYRTKTMEHAI